MIYDGNFLGFFGFLTSIPFRRVQERAIQSPGERIMIMQRHEEMKEHKGQRTYMPEEQFFRCFPMHLLKISTHLRGR